MYSLPCAHLHGPHTCTAFPALIFMDPTNAQQHFMLVSYTKLQPHHMPNVETTKQPFIYIPKYSMAFTVLIFMKLASAQIFVWTSPVLSYT
jgi:hypothetical protein